VEFTAQVFQLVRGGRDPGLQVRPTLAALHAVAARGWLPAEARYELEAAYRFLRNLEHRLQYLEDQQTQTLPAGEEDRARVVEAMAFAGWDGLLAALAAHRQRVERHFDGLFAGDAGVPGEDPLDELASARAGAERVEGALAALGFEDPAALIARVAQLRDSARFKRMAASGQARVDRLLPRLARAAAAHPPRDLTFARLLGLVESIGRRESYLALLLEYPAALAAVARLVSLSAWACDYLARHPVLLDELIDPRELAEPDWPALEATLRDGLAAEPAATDRQMDLLRQFQHAQTFRLLVLDLSGRLSLERLSDHLSELADVVMRRVLDCAWPQLRTRHREQPRFAVIGYGKLGGKELGYASDLDLIFLHDDLATEAPEAYARLAQRINTWLTSHTGAGTLYETDLRLRPDGASGLLVSTLEAFGEYQRRQAWVWEHQALTRARFVAGDPQVGAAFERLRVEILRLPRDPAGLRAEVLAIRARMREAHPNATGSFDLKHDPGGIVDVEFAVQYLVLAHAHAHEALTRNAGNIALLGLAGSLGLVDAAVAAGAASAYRDFRRAQHALRLRGEARARAGPVEFLAQRKAALALWHAVMEA
jgi:glutamate-ammonia-ligase adenylyltransferase